MTFFPRFVGFELSRRYRIYLFSAWQHDGVCTGHDVHRRAARASAAASVTGQGNSSIPSEITVTWQGVPTTGPTAASTYIVEIWAANVAVFEWGLHALERGISNQRKILFRGERMWRSASSPEAVVNVSGTIPAGEPAVGIRVVFR